MERHATRILGRSFPVMVILMNLLSACGTPAGDSTPQLIQIINGVQLTAASVNNVSSLEIHVTGTVTTTGWTTPFLEAVKYITPPQDGIYEYSFYATPPAQQPPDEQTPIEVTQVLDSLPTGFKGVRIVADTNSVVAMLNPGTPDPAPVPDPAPEPVPSIVNSLTHAQLDTVASQPDQLDITVEGTVIGDGWTNPTLVAAQYITPPQDGIYDYTFYATPPANSTNDKAVSIAVTQRLNAIPANFNGARIHSQTNELLLMYNAGTPAPKPQPILEMTDISLTIPQADSKKLIIDASGVVNSEGWTQPLLVPFEYLIPPADGIYEFTFMATPPSVAGADVVTNISLTHELYPRPDNLKGVRIYAETNNLEKRIPLVPPPPQAEAVNEITAVTLSLPDVAPQQLDIHVTGNVIGAGWSSPKLVPFQTLVPPQDGIYDFTFMATPPVDMTNTDITPIEVAHRLAVIPDNMQGIRIHSATNFVVSLVVKPIPPPVPEIIHSITDVGVSYASNAQNEIDIHVTGMVNSGGWTQPMLIPWETGQPPPDGMYDFDFYATPPSGGAGGAFGPIEVTHRLSSIPSGFTGVRIHAQTNNLSALPPTPPSQSACDFVRGKVFQTAEQFPGGLGISYFWIISFLTDGTFRHATGDTGGQGIYQCDAQGFHLYVDSGAPYVPWNVTVNIIGQSVDIPVAADTSRLYYLKTQ